MNNRRAFIIGLKSTILTKKEFFLLKKYKPWGVILFSRNIKTIKQTKNLTTSIKNLFKDNNVVRLEHDLDEIRLKNPYLFKKNLNDLGITHPNLTKS